MTGEVRDGARDLDDAVVGARGEMHFLEGGREELLRLRLERAEALE